MKKYDIDFMLELWSAGSSVTAQNPYPSTDDDGEAEDVEHISSKDSDLTTHVKGPDPYIVNKSPLQVTEADDEAANNKGDVIKTQEPAPPETLSNNPSPPPEMDPSMMQGGQDMPQDPNAMGGMETPEGPSTPVEVGRIYELKKIYSRLVSVQSYLAGTTDVNLIKLRNYVSNTIDLFRTLISNIKLYSDKLDEIIITFYKVVDNVYKILSKYYKDKDTGRMVRAVE